MQGGGGVFVGHYGIGVTNWQKVYKYKCMTE